MHLLARCWRASPAASRRASELWQPPGQLQRDKVYCQAQNTVMRPAHSPCMAFSAVTDCQQSYDRLQRNQANPLMHQMSQKIHHSLLGRIGSLLVDAWKAAHGRLQATLSLKKCAASYEDSLLLRCIIEACPGCGAEILPSGECGACLCRHMAAIRRGQRGQSVSCAA